MEKVEFRNNHLADLLYFYRLKEDLMLAEDKIQENQLIEVESEKNPFVKFWNKNIENARRSDELEKYTEQKGNIERRISDFLSSHSDFDYEEYVKVGKIQDYIDKELKDDKASLARVNLALLVVLQDKDFVYVEETKQAVSRLLFDNKTTVKQLQEKLEKNYIKISGKTTFDEVGKTVLLGIGLATAATGLWAGALAGGALLDVLVGSALYSAVVVGISAIVYKSIDSVKKDDIKKEFRKLSSSDAGAMFAIKATLIEEAKKRMSKQEFEEFLDSNLRLASDLRSDVEFMLLVEKKDIEQAKGKIKVFNNWTNRLATLVVD